MENTMDGIIRAVFQWSLLMEQTIMDWLMDGLREVDLLLYQP